MTEGDDESLEKLLQGLILQPLVENAIKYAISPSEDGGTLKISAKVHSGMLMLQLADNGPGHWQWDERARVMRSRA